MTSRGWRNADMVSSMHKERAQHLANSNNHTVSQPEVTTQPMVVVQQPVCIQHESLPSQTQTQSVGIRPAAGSQTKRSMLMATQSRPGFAVRTKRANDDALVTSPTHRTPQHVAISSRARNMVPLRRPRLADNIGSVRTRQSRSPPRKKARPSVKLQGFKRATAPQAGKRDDSDDIFSFDF